MQSETAYGLVQACPNIYALQATMAKRGIHEGNMKFSTKLLLIRIVTCVI